jgi:glycosyltransferase involved in cell wall biosynthesis
VTPAQATGGHDAPAPAVSFAAVDLSVVIPAHNVAETLGEQLDALLGETWDGEWEIVVVDNRSTDGTAALALQYAGRDARVRVIDAPDRAGLCYSREAGVRAAVSDRVAVCDGDDVVEPGWVRAMGEALREHRVVTGPLDVDRLNPPWLVETRGRLDSEGVRTWFGAFPVIAGGNLGIRKDVFDEVGGFDQGYIGAEDHEFSLRLAQHGIPIHFAPDARIAYRYRSEASVLWRQGNTYGRSRPRLRRRVVEAGLPAPSRFAGWRSWLWLLRHLPGLGSPEGRARWAWVAGNRVGQLRGSVEARSVFV